MRRGALIGRIFHTDIYATGGFLLLMVLLLVMNSDAASEIAAIEIAFIISVLVHEFGHVFAVRRFTGNSSIVVLWGLGGLCIHEPTPDVKKRIGISLMGPAFGLLLAGACWAAVTFLLPEKPHAAVGLFFNWMIVAGIFYNLLNLLPVLPMDGGQATLAILELRLTGPKALRLARRISVITAALGLAAAATFSAHFVILIMALFLVQNLVAARHGL